MHSSMVSTLAVVNRDQKAGIDQDGRHDEVTLYQSRLPLAPVIHRNFFPKPSICFLFVARSVTPKSKQPDPMSSGTRLRACLRPQ